MRCFISIILFFIGLCYHAQTLSPKLNSLLSNKQPTDQAYLIDSAAVSVRDVNLKQALSLFNYNLSLERKHQLNKEFIKTTLSLSRTYRNIGSYDTAQLYIDSAIVFANKHNLNQMYGKIYDFEGVIYLRKGDYEKAVRSLYKSINYSLSNNDSLMLHDAYNHLGSVYFYRQNFQEACSMYKKSLSFLPASESKRRFSSIYDNIGLCFSNLNQYDSALFYQTLTFKSINIKEDSLFYAETCINLASTYMLLKDYESARPYLVDAIIIATNLKNEYSQLVSNLTLGRLYFNTHEIDKAIFHLSIAYKLANKLNILNQIKETCSSLAESYAAKQDYKNAYLYSSQLEECMLKLFEEENSKALNELTTKYETDQKQQQILLLTKESELKQETIKVNRIIYIGIASILLLICMFFIYLFRKKKNDNKILIEKNEAIALQKNQIELQNKELGHKNTEITDSINYAQRIQSSIIPSSTFMQSLLPESFIYFKPKDIISGDFYWITEVNQKIYFAVADCTGHGVPGAMMSMLGSSLLDKIISTKNNIYPADILSELHKEIVIALNENISQRKSKDGMDIALLMFDKVQKKLFFSGAGRPAYIIQNNELQIVKGDKYSIGGILDIENTRFSQHQIDITNPVYVYLFSDGVPDQFGGSSGKKFMIKNLQQLLLKLHHQPIKIQYQLFETEFANWKGNTEQTDDVCLAGIKF